MTQKRALVTGATGFIGSHLARRLVADGWLVGVIARPKSDRGAIADLTAKITVHEHDGTSDGMISVMQDARPDVVFHLASLFLSQHGTKDIEPLVRSNVLFGTQLLEAMAVTGTRQLVNTGTSWQHFESKRYSPVNLYAATKQAFESILQFYVEAGKLKAITLKLFDTYGPDDPRPKLFALLRKSIQEEKPLEMSAGEQLIDLVYIDDVVDAFLKAGERLAAGDSASVEEYAVSSGNPVKLRQLVEIYSRVIGRPLPVVWGARPYRVREVMIPWRNGPLLPGWQPQVNLEDGIRKMERTKGDRAV